MPETEGIVKPLKKYALATDTARVWQEFAWRGDRLVFVQNDTTDLQVMFDEKGSEQDIIDIPKISFGSRQITVEYHPVDGKPLYFSKVFLKHSAVTGGKITAIVGGEASVVSTASGVSDVELKEALREELKEELSGVAKSFHKYAKPWALNEVNNIIEFTDGRLYVAQGPGGPADGWSLWRYDDEGGWSEVYKDPTVGGVTWVSAVFKNKLIFGGQIFPGETVANTFPTVWVWDGTTVTRVVLAERNEEVLGLCVYGDYVYASVGNAEDGYGKVYRSADGSTWVLSHTTSTLNRQFGGCAVYKEKLYVGGSDSYMEVFDGTSWSTVNVGDRNHLLVPFDGYLYIGSAKSIYTYDGATVTKVCTLPASYIGLRAISNRTLIAVVGDVLETYAGASDARGYSEVWVSHGFSNFSGGFRKVAEFPFGIMSCAISLHRGRLYIGSTHSYAYDPATGSPWNTKNTYIEPATPAVYVFNLFSFLNAKPTPSSWALWDGTSIVANAETDPVPVFGFDSVTIYFKTSATGNLSILVDSEGDGSFDTYDTVSFSGAGSYFYPMAGKAIYLKLKFDAAATVSAKVLAQ